MSGEKSLLPAALMGLRVKTNPTNPIHTLEATRHDG
jgi:hypothetical protein